MVNAPTHDLSYDLGKAAMRYRNGDILAVHRTSDLADLVGSNYVFRDVISSPRSAFIHIRDVPTNLARKIRDRLTASISATGDDLRRRKFRIPPSVIPASFRNKILTDREATITFANVKAHIRKKAIVDALDPTKDDESTALVDADLL